MFQMRQAHMQAFAETSKKSFENRMVEHLNKHFPEHCDKLGEEGVRETIRYGIDRAASYDITAERDVCKYIDLMFVFGQDFDQDEKYPWARKELEYPHRLSRHRLIDRLCDAAQQDIQRRAGQM